MKNNFLLYAVACAFALGIFVGAVFFIIFQSYVFILAVFGFAVLVAKIPKLASKVLNQNKEKTNATN